MELKAEIISRSEKLFLKLGIRSVTMNDISRELGMSKKTLYQYFANKDSLVETVISTHVEREQQEIERVCSTATDALDEMRRMGTFIIGMIDDVSASALYDLQKYYRKSWELLIRKQDENVKNCVISNLKRGIAEGLYRREINVEIIAKIYAKSTYMVLDEMSDSTSKYLRRELIWELHNYHVHAIATENGLALWKKYSEEFKKYGLQTESMSQR